MKVLEEVVGKAMIAGIVLVHNLHVYFDQEAVSDGRRKTPLSP